MDLLLYIQDFSYFTFQVDKKKFRDKPRDQDTESTLMIRIKFFTYREFN